MSNKLALWSPVKAVVPSNLSSPDKLASYALQLSSREQRQIIQAFEAEHYEMAIAFVWSKAMASLKRHLESLGREFVREMLGRQDIGPDTSLVQSLTDVEAVRLGEELGMYSGTSAMRLRQAHSIVLHFSNSPDKLDDDDQVEREEAVLTLKSVVRAILAHEHLGVALEFMDFRNVLERKALSDSSEEVRLLVDSPYFFKRTTLRVLLAAIKAAEGSVSEAAMANLSTILPLVWGDLLKSDKWDVGRSYAEFHAAGKTSQTKGVRRALLKVKGFDFVPENLRSNSFIEAANRVIRAHYGFDNFYNEPAPMRALTNLGSVVPSAALSRCFTAALCVKLGNRYGFSSAAQRHADRFLALLTKDRWVYYLEECLPGDRDILDKLSDSFSSMRDRWGGLVRGGDLEPALLAKVAIRRLFVASQNGEMSRVRREAENLKRKLT